MIAPRQHHYNMNINELAIMSDISLLHMLGLTCHMHWKVYFMDSGLKIDQNNANWRINCTEKIFVGKHSLMTLWFVEFWLFWCMDSYFAVTVSMNAKVQGRWRSYVNTSFMGIVYKRLSILRCALLGFLMDKQPISHPFRY